MARDKEGVSQNIQIIPLSRGPLSRDHLVAGPLSRRPLRREGTFISGRLKLKSKVISGDLDVISRD